MHDLGQYILSVSLAALFAVIITEFSDRKSPTGTVIRMLCGLFLAIVVLDPVTKLDFSILEAFSQELELNAASAVSAGSAQAEESLRQLIKEETEAYILDKARSMGCEPDVDVTVGAGEISVPEAVRITGEVSPAIRQELENILEQELGITKEKQRWTG